MNNNDNSNTTTTANNNNNKKNKRVCRLVETTREGSPCPASACLNWLALMQYVWKGNGNHTRLSQSASHELLITDFGCLAGWCNYIFAH